MNDRPPTSISATLSYLQPPVEQPYNYAFAPPDGAPWQNYDVNPVTVQIDDRRAQEDLSVQGCGFARFDDPLHLPGWHRDDTSTDDWTNGWTDDARIARDYYPLVAALALRASGATRAWVFDHLVRRVARASGPLGFGRAARGQPAAANGAVHNDYTEQSGRHRLSMVLGDQLASVEGKRFSILNIWRSLSGPVRDTPLALCDARTVDARDLVVAEVRYPRRNGEIYLLASSQQHRWSYFADMDLDEAIVFKQYDSQLGGVARFTPHAAFRHPHAPPDAPTRVSIEARCLVMYDTTTETAP